MDMNRKLSPKQTWVLGKLGINKGYTEYGLTKLYLTEYPKFLPVNPKCSVMPSMYDQFNMHKTLTSLISKKLVRMVRHDLIRHYYAA